MIEPVTDTLSILLAIALGIGLAAATGFRVFLPFFIAGAAARLELLPLADSFEWLATTPALLMLATAAFLEALAYYIPGVDHLLDVAATPTTIAAGMIVSASVMADVPPAVMWPVAVIAGGGVAGLIKGSTALLRGQTAAATGGFGNPVVSTVENVGAAVLAVLAILLPLLGVVAVVALLLWGIRRSRRLFSRSRQ